MHGGIGFVSHNLSRWRIAVSGFGHFGVLLVFEDIVCFFLGRGDCAGALPLHELARLVRKRGTFMVGWFG